MKFSKKKSVFGIIIITLVLCIFECVIVWGKNIEISLEVQPELSFSHESGFYEEEFELVLSSDEGKIYYTLDGTEPDSSSILYDGPIFIKDASLNENVHSMRTDVSTGFMEEKIEKYSSDQKYIGYTVPDFLIDKATIVRAVVYYNAFHHSEIKTASYFVGYSEKPGYEGMNLISIVTDPDNLFDYEEGIYVTGESFDEYWEDRPPVGETIWTDDNWMWWLTNYQNRGKAWEREASCQFYDSEGNLFLNQNCGIRIHGGISRGQNPKGLNLYAREEYDGNDKFLYDFWDNGYYASTITLSQGGNDYIAKVRDNLFTNLLKDANLNITLPAYEPYIMFLDGEYWGVYWLGERYDETYLEHYYGINNENIVMIKSEELEIGSEEDIRLYESLLQTCETLDLTLAENYAEVCELIDIDSYIDYYAVMLYSARFKDWPNSNFAMWRTKYVDENQAYSDGKWRWMVYDMNSPGMSEEFADFDSIDNTMIKNEMFWNLMTNETFRHKLLTRMDELRNTVFTKERVNELLDEHTAVMMEPLLLDQRRFFNETSEERIITEIETVRRFFEKRSAWVEEAVKRYW